MRNRRGRGQVTIAYLLMAAVAALLVVVLAVRQITRASTTEVWTAKSALKAGQKIDASQLVVSRVAKNAVPAGAIKDPAAILGRVLQVPVAEGAPLRMQEFVTQGEQVWLSDAPPPGRVVMTIPVPRIVPVKQFRKGDRIDLLMANRNGEATVVARDALYIGALQGKASAPAPAANGLIPGLTGERRGGGGVAAVVLAVREADVSALAAVQGQRRALTFALRGAKEPPYVPLPVVPTETPTVEVIMGSLRQTVDVSR